MKIAANESTSLRSGTPDYHALLDWMDQSVANGTVERPRAKNRETRFKYRHRLDVLVRHPGGGGNEFQIHSRNISAGGIGFLCDTFVHPGSTCSVMLVSLDGEKVKVNGKIAFCRLVRGRIHEVGVRFEQQIMPGSFVATRADQRALPKPGEMNGRVLWVESSAIDQALIQHYLADTRIGLTLVSNETEAKLKLSQAAQDILIFNSTGMDAAEFVKSIRSGGFVGPIVAAATELTPAILGPLHGAGVDLALPKPYRPNTLLPVIGRALYDGGTIPDPHLTINAREHHADVGERSAKFLSQASTMAARIRQALSGGAAAEARRACTDLNASAVAAGYVHLAAAADAAAETVAARSAFAARGALLRLAAACDALSRQATTAAA